MPQKNLCFVLRSNDFLLFSVFLSLFFSFDIQNRILLKASEPQKTVSAEENISTLFQGFPTLKELQSACSQIESPSYFDLCPETERIDASTMDGKVLCGYQGWFATPNDGTNMGWSHYDHRGGFEPGRCSIDLWPDMSELDPDEKVETSFRHSDGTTATVFSSANRKTVERHFFWMRSCGLDGVFLQRFASTLKSDVWAKQRNVVMNNVRLGSHFQGRTWAMMYDLSGCRKGDIRRVLIEDWKKLVEQAQITQDPTYLQHRGKPVVAVWGIGFSDNRAYTLEESLELIEFLKNDPKYGGCCVMIGVPTYWREGKNDALPDPLLQKCAETADIVSPWTIGRFRNPKQVEEYAQKTMRQDYRWCKEHRVEFLPVAYPGFSWQNMHTGNSRPAELGEIPRLKGSFLQTMFDSYQKENVSMIYMAMFDEIDEGTAIFKCTNNPPVGKSAFLTFEDLPSDYYLKMVGEVAKQLRQNSKQ